MAGIDSTAGVYLDDDSCAEMLPDGRQQRGWRASALGPRGGRTGDRSWQDAAVDTPPHAAVIFALV